MLLQLLKVNLVFSLETERSVPPVVVAHSLQPNYNNISLSVSCRDYQRIVHILKILPRSENLLIIINNNNNNNNSNDSYSNNNTNGNDNNDGNNDNNNNNNNNYYY